METTEQLDCLRVNGDDNYIGLLLQPAPALG
ncbi:hypothetical protein DFAR_3320008 [Desulfarculales bacterium]